MTDAGSNPDTHDIVVDEVFTHAPETIWKALTTGELIARWLMPPTGFEAVKGKRFTFHTKAAGAWDGTIHCEVLEAVPNERFVYSWKGGHEKKCRIRCAAGDDRHVDALQSRKWNAPSAGPFRIHHAAERVRTQDHGRGPEEGYPEDRRHHR